MSISNSWSTELKRINRCFHLHRIEFEYVISHRLQLKKVYDLKGKLLLIFLSLVSIMCALQYIK